MKRNKLSAFANSGITVLPEISARANDLMTVLRRGDEARELIAKIETMKAPIQPRKRIHQLAPNMLVALGACLRGGGSGFPPQFQADAAYVLAYLLEPEDMTPDYREDGLKDDCRALEIATDFYKPELEAFLIKNVRPRIGLLWAETGRAA